MQNDLSSLIEILNYKFLSLPLYKIIIAFLFLFGFLLLRRAFTLYILRFFRFLVRKTKTELDDKFLEAIKRLGIL